MASEPTATFHTEPGIISFTSNRPGSHAVMFGPRGEPLRFRDDASRFDDVGSVYTWAFAHDHPIAAGQRFTFATLDRAVAGVAGDDLKIQVDPVRPRLARDADNRPLRLLPSPHVPATRAPVLHPKASVITCTYNRAAMLRECVASMRAQTDPDWEHLIVDNGSTHADVSPALDEIAANDARVRVYRRSPGINKPAIFWNEMIDRVRGRYVGFLDDDNAKCPEWLATLSDVLDTDPDVDMVTCGWVVIDKEGNTSECHANLETSASTVALRSTVDTGAFLIRREALEAIGYFPLDIRTNEDWAMMRRAVTCLKMAHLPHALATYRTHSGQRMEMCEALGNSRDKAIVEGSVWGPFYGVRVHHPPLSRLTMSQRDVVRGILGGVAEIPWVDPDGSDLAIVVAPFQMDVGEAVAIAGSARSVLSVHMEDPYAVHANATVLRAMAQRCEDTWVSSNDVTCHDVYRSIVGERLIACPSLSIDYRQVRDLDPEPRVHDAALVGYAYPSRVAFLRELGEHFDVGRVALYGDGWAEAGFRAAAPTRTFAETAAVYARSRAVICAHRAHGDCTDGPREPQLVARGYVEGFAGARVFVDATRPEHGFEAGEVEWWCGPRDLAEALEEFLALPAHKQHALAEPLRLRALRDFTYRARMARVINAVRSPRFGAVIP